MDNINPQNGFSQHPGSPWTGNRPGLQDEFSPNAIDLYMAALQRLPLLSRDEFDALKRELRAHEAQFRETVCGIPGAAYRVLDRWNERRAEGFVTGLLARAPC
jgi:hypothetical protein